MAEKSEVEKIIEKKIKEMSTDKPKVYNIMEDTNFGEEYTGQQYSTCTICGVEFEQNKDSLRHRYTQYNTCPACRSKMQQRRFKEEKANETGMVRKMPYEPWEWQKEAFEEFKKHRFQVLACGIRTGKDFYSMNIFFAYIMECLCENRHLTDFNMIPPVRGWIIAPQLDIAKQNWQHLLSIIKKVFPNEKEFIVACDNGSMTMQTVGGGIIEVKTALNPKMLVGVGLDIAVITEAAIIKDLEEVWVNVEGRLNSHGRGLESDRKGASYGMGKAIINSSPEGLNQFYKMFQWGNKNSDTYSSDWTSTQLPWTANPDMALLAKKIVHTKYGDITYEQNLISRIGKNNYEKKYMGNFLPSDGVAFKNFVENCVTDIYSGEYASWNKTKRDLFIKEWQDVQPYREYRISYDPATGSSSDSPTLLIRDMETNNIVRAIDMYGKSYEQQYDTIAVYSKKYNGAVCVYSDTGHTPVIGNLEKRGVPEIVIHEQGKMKEKYIQSLVLAVENKDVHILFDGSEDTKTLCNQMNDYKEKNGKYGNDEEPHDDFVSALYISYYDYGETVNEVLASFDFAFITY